MTRLLLLCAILCILVAAATDPAAAAAPRKMVFFFFVSGKSAASYPKEEVQKMQNAHLANIRRLYKEGILKLAGPCADPDKRRRGIILMDVPSLKELDKHFTEDPYVREGIMKMEAFPVKVETLQVGAPSETEISQHTIALIEGSGDSDRTRFDPKLLRSLPEAERPPIVLAASAPGKIRAVLFFGSSKPADVQSSLQQLSPVRDGKLRATAFGQWMGKGMLPSKEG